MLLLVKHRHPPPRSRSCPFFTCASTCISLSWVTEAFHARFPVSVKSSPLVSSAFGRRNEAPRRTREKTSGTQGICIYFKTENWLKRWKYNSMRNASSIWCMTSSNLKISFSVHHTCKREASVFKISALGPFLKTCVSGSRKRCLHADGTPTRRKIVRF